MSQIIRTYTELIKQPTFLDKYRYLRLGGKVGEETFGWERYLNQSFYRSNEWRRFRREIILRDNGCDLGDLDHPFAEGEQVLIHHLNPINTKDIVYQTDYLMDPEFVISVRKKTHDAIHYGDESLLFDLEPVIRRLNDTCPWKSAE